MSRIFRTFMLIFLFHGGTVFGFPGEAPPRENWYCTATGYDDRHVLHTVSGDDEPSQFLARQSALRICNQIYRACQPGSCFMTGPNNEIFAEESNSGSDF